MATIRYIKLMVNRCFNGSVFKDRFQSDHKWQQLTTKLFFNYQAAYICGVAQTNVNFYSEVWYILWEKKVNIVSIFVIRPSQSRAKKTSSARRLPS